MGEETDLLELITKHESSVHSYLSDVSIEEFIADVQSLAKKHLDKVILESTIEKLRQLL